MNNTWGMKWGVIIDKRSEITSWRCCYGTPKVQDPRCLCFPASKINENTKDLYPAPGAEYKWGFLGTSLTTS